MKSTIKKLLGKRLALRLGAMKSRWSRVLELASNTYRDGRLYYKHSMVFRTDTFNKIESRIILHYHGIEKGFLHENFKHRFGEPRVRALVDLLRRDEIVKNHTRTQIAAAYLAMCRYYERHQSDGIDISDYFDEEAYDLFKRLSTLDQDIVKSHECSGFFEGLSGDFASFARSRGSVRSFLDEMIPLETINKVIELASTAPSVCNRQPAKVYYVEDREKIRRILTIQQGLKGYSEGIRQLFVLVSDRSYFYTVGERNQFYVDGGIFLMNLLYALHYHRIGACPAHWGHNSRKDEMIKAEIPISDAEKVICIVPIGFPAGSFRTTLSLRRDPVEILQVVD